MTGAFAFIAASMMAVHAVGTIALIAIMVDTAVPASPNQSAEENLPASYLRLLAKGMCRQVP